MTVLRMPTCYQERFQSVLLSSNGCLCFRYRQRVLRFARGTVPRGVRALRYLFGDCALDTELRELRRGAGSVAIEPQVFDLLVHLICNRERVVSRDDLLASVWRGRIVSEAALSTRLNAARSAVGDNGLRQDLIKTFQRKGFRFIGAVREEQRQTAAAAAEPPTPAFALPDRPSIAVLPFTNMSGDFEQEYIADGFVEDITTELSRFRDLFVTARNSSFHYKGRAVDVRQVGHELGVRYVLEGSIRRDGDRFRITAQLIDTTSGVHRWAERYDRDAKDLFAVQDEVARTVAAILAAHVSKAEAERTLLKPPTNLQAYDFYIRAAEVYATFHRDMQAPAIYETRRLLERCLAMEPGYARAYGLYSSTKVSTWALSLDGDHLNPSALEDAQRWAEQALQLDPNLPQAHAQMGYVLCLRGMSEVAVAQFERALQLNPNYTDWRYAAVLVFAGQAERGIIAAKAHLRIDPFALPIARGHLGLAYLFLRRYSDAVAPLREFVSQSPNHRPGRLWLTVAYAHLGQLEEARTHAAQLLRIDPDLVATRRSRAVDASFMRLKDAEHLDDGLRKVGLLA